MSIFEILAFPFAHLKNVHNVGKGAQEFKCPEDGCDYVTKQKFQVSIHFSKVHQGVKFSCNECSYSSGYKGDLNRHIKVVHQGLKFKCEFCDYTTHSKTFLTGHMIKSHSTKVWYLSKNLSCKLNIEESSKVKHRI